MDLDVISVELTYGLSRIAMLINQIDHAFDLPWGEFKSPENGDEIMTITSGLIDKEFEEEFSIYNHEQTDIQLSLDLFKKYESEAVRLLNLGLIFPGYDYVIKCSHIFNILEARGAISVSERTGYIARVRRLAKLTAKKYLEKREQLGYPLLKK